MTDDKNEQGEQDLREIDAYIAMFHNPMYQQDPGARLLKKARNIIERQEKEIGELERKRAEWARPRCSSRSTATSSGGKCWPPKS